MKYLLSAFIIVISACNGEPLSVPKPVETVWIDADSDTVTTNVDDNQGILFYALKNWQASADTNISHGYRYIAGRQADTVIVYKLNDPGSAQGPFICGNSINSDTLKSQNFLDTLAVNPVKAYIKLK